MQLGIQKAQLSKWGTAVFFGVALAACSSTGSDVEGDDSAAAPTSTAPRTNSEATPTGVDSTPALTAEQIREQEMLAVTIFYFDFDKSDLKPEAREALVYHANQLKANPNMSVRLEGHADERGTREYNLALGERRSQSVERYLQVQGVSARQMETVSYGEERPVDTGTTEAAYARNRRVEVIY